MANELKHVDPGPVLTQAEYNAGSGAGGHTIDSGVIGDIVAFNGTALVRVAAGAVGTALVGNGVGVMPSFGAVPAGDASTLTGNTLAANVVNSSLTSVGTLTSLTVAGNIVFSGASRNIIQGTTNFSIRNNANSFDNMLITDAGAVTFRSTVGGITTLTATTLAGTLSTAAQTSVTSLGTLTSLTIAGNLTFSGASRNIIAGTTNFSLRNNANNADNMLVTDAGAVTFRLTVSGITTLTATTLAGTLSTAAQTNVTSLGTLTALTIAGNLTFSGASRNIIQGTTDFALRNNANNANNLLMTDAGVATFRAAVGGITTLTVTTQTIVPSIVAATAGNVALVLAAFGTELINFNSGTYSTLQSYSPGVGGTATLNLALGDWHFINMPAGNITIALSNPKTIQTFSIRILQDGVGSRTVTWFTTIRWVGGVAPTLTTTANKADTFTFVTTGAGTYDGYVSGQNI